MRLISDVLQNLADENLTLFLHCFSKGHATLQATSLHILCDVLSSHPSVLEPSAPSVPADGTTAPAPSTSMRKQLLKPFSKGLKAAHTPEVQTAAAIALCKLLLLRIVSSPRNHSSSSDTAPSPAAKEDDEAAELLRQLATTFFDAVGDAASVRDNPAARQALSYFLPAFAHGRAENAVYMARIAPAVLQAVATRRVEEAELEDDSDEEYVAPASAGADGNKVSLKVVGEMLVDWTDPRKLVVQDDSEAGRWDEAGKKEGRAVDGRVHLVLAEGALECALAHGCSKDERKALLSMVGKLYTSAHSSLELSRSVLTLAQEAAEEKVAPDATSRNALNKFITSLEKAIATMEGKEKPARGRKSVAVRGSSQENAQEMTVIEEEPEAVEEDTKMGLNGSGSGGDGDGEPREDAAES